ncbi:hypothetical protein GCM10027511_41300 [Hymenobacter humi]
MVCWLVILKCLTSATLGHAQSRPDTLRHADWHLYWHDEFDRAGDSSTVARHWQFAYPWGRTLGGNEGEYYSGQQVSADTAGVLHLRARRRAAPRHYQMPGGPIRQLQYESGMLFSRAVQDSMRLPACGERTGFTYGLFEIRCRMPSTPNSFSAFWLYGNPDEVDIFEAGGSDLISNNVIHGSHEFWRPGPDEASQSFFYWPGPGRLTDGFHTLALSWQPQELVYYFDGLPIRRETRLLPLGCSLELIANLAMFNWASAQTASFDIDYIRVYKSRKTLAQGPVRPVAPAAGAYLGPRSPDGVRGATRPEMRWRVLEQLNQRPRLVLETNLNPRDFNTLALPSQGRWAPSMPSFNEADSPRHYVAAPDADSGRAALSWTIYDLCGRPIQSGRQLPAAGWELSWPGLVPGAYSLSLQIGNRQLYQNLYQLGRPARSEFTARWLVRPAAALPPE